MRAEYNYESSLCLVKKVRTTLSCPCRVKAIEKPFTLSTQRDIKSEKENLSVGECRAG